MRELEFLPGWYPTLRRKRRHVLIEAWLTGALVFALVLWMLLAQRNAHAAQTALASFQGELKSANERVKQLDELQQLKQQMTRQAQIVNQLGPHVPIARLLDALDGLLTKDMAVLDLSADTEEQPRQLSGLAQASGATPGVDRHLKIRLHGVAPTDEELGHFMDALSSIPRASDVLMNYSKDRVESGHLMREFEITFQIDLSTDDQ